MFVLDCKDPRPLHVKLYNQIKNQILAGKLISETHQSDKNYPTRVMLGFGRMNPDELEKGIKLLAQAWEL